MFEGRAAALVLSHDVTERLRLEERLGQAEKMEAIGRLAGGVAHDFNNLLTVISGYTEILLADADVPRREQLGEIAHAAEQAAGLTRQLLAFSRRQVLHPRVLDLNEIVAGMEPMVRRIIGDDVSVGVRLTPGLAPVEADQAQIERVILNLAANARDAMPDGGRLTIETANVEFDEEFVASRGEGTAGPNVLLAVSDTGVGMSDDVQRHLFEPFFTTKSPGAGTGLGLATVFGVVKQSGGSIYVYSEEGPRHDVQDLPAGRGRADRARPPAADGAAERGSETIMIVEDDESVRDLVRIMLETKGYSVLAAAGAEEAERLCTDAVDLLLTDVVMPEVNGRALAERLSLASPSMRILFMSGYSDEAVYRHGEISPNAAFIEKPFTDRTLARKVREVLDGLGDRAAADAQAALRLGVDLDAVPGGIGVRVMEDVVRTLALAKLDREAVARLVVGHRHDHLVVVLAPEQPDVDAVVRAVVKFAKGLVHGTGKVPSRGPCVPWRQPVRPRSGWLA